MAGATNLSDLELEGRGIQAREIDSGEASEGDVLTADGAGGAAWVQPAAGRRRCLHRCRLVGSAGHGSVGGDERAYLRCLRDRDGCGAGQRCAGWFR